MALDRARDSYEIKQLLWYIDTREVELRFLVVFSIPFNEPMRILSPDEVAEARQREYERRLMFEGIYQITTE